MEKEQSHMTERILKLTLEIIHLLTGEKYIAFKLTDCLVASDVMMIQRPTSHSVKNNKKVQEVTNEIIGLLTGEDVAFSSCTSDVMVENWTTLTPLGEPRNFPKRSLLPLYSQNFAQEHQEIPKVDQVIADKIQTDVKEAEDSYVRVDNLCKEEEILSAPITDAQKDYIAEGEEGHVQVKVEEVPPEIFSDGQNKMNKVKNCPIMSPEVGDHSTVVHNLNLLRPNRDLSFDASTYGQRFPDHYLPVTHLAAYREEETFVCSERIVSQRAILVPQQRNHTEEKPFSCPICGKCVSRKSFIEHRKTHAGEKPYSCSECGKCFSRIAHLIIHHRIHTEEKPYPCLECGKRFTQVGNLTVHQRSHTGEKPYACSVCGKRFRISSAVTRHKKIHTKEKPY